MTNKDADHKEHITIADLVTMELEGKNSAQAGYDEILWKLRAGYAIVIYSGLSLFATLGDKSSFSVTPLAALSIVSLFLLGFTLIIAVLDIAFLKSKLRVVEARDELFDLTIRLSAAETSQMSERDRDRLRALLHNSGEPKKAVNWNRYDAQLPPILIYGGTCVIAIAAIAIIYLAPPPSHATPTAPNLTPACVYIVQYPHTNGLPQLGVTNTP